MMSEERMSGSIDQIDQLIKFETGMWSVRVIRKMLPNCRYFSGRFDYSMEQPY